MPGLIDGQMKNKSGVPMPAAQAAAPAQPKKTDPAVARIEIAAKKILAQPKVAQQMIAIIKASGDPVQGIAKAAQMLMKQLFALSKGTMPTQAIIPAGMLVAVDVAKLAESAGLYKVTPETIKAVTLAIGQLMKQAYMARKQGQQQPASPAAPAAPAAPPQPVAQPPAAAPMPGAAPAGA